MEVKTSDIQKRYALMSDADLASMKPESLTEEARAIFHAELERRGHSEQSFAVLQEDAAQMELSVKQGSRSKHIYNIKWVLYTLLAGVVISIAAVAAKKTWGGSAGTLTRGILAIAFVCIAIKPRIKKRKL